MKAHHALVADFIRFSWVDGPGNRFVLFLQGCNLNCLACHNPQTIPLHSPKASLFSVDEIKNEIRASLPYISGVTVSGGEASLQHDFVYELFKSLKEDPTLRHLSTFIDSNGNNSLDVWQKLCAVTDGVMVDLKVLDDRKHFELTGSSNHAVLRTIEFLSQKKKLHEVRLLLVPDHNDSDEDLQATSHYLMNVDPQMRIKINSFMTHGVRSTAKQWSEPNEADKERYRRVLSMNGVTNIA